MNRFYYKSKFISHKIISLYRTNEGEWRFVCTAIDVSSWLPAKTSAIGSFLPPVTRKMLLAICLIAYVEFHTGVSSDQGQGHSKTLKFFCISALDHDRKCKFSSHVHPSLGSPILVSCIFSSVQHFELKFHFLTVV